MKRVLTALAFLPVFVAVVGWGPVWAFALLAALAAALGALELAGLARRSGLAVAPLPAAALAAAAPLIFLSPGRAGEWALLLLATALLAALLRALRGEPGEALGGLAGTVLAVVYPGLLLAFLVGLRAADDDRGRRLVFFLCAVIWISDTAAYYGGRAVGRRSLSRLSPGKTVEGAVAGIAGAALASVACRYLFLPELGWAAGPLGAALATVGIAGDLGESALKRGAGVKDTARILPGHGGILDRVDSLLLAGPLFYYLYPWVLGTEP